MAHFKIEDLTFSYPGREEDALKHIDLTVGKGEYVVLCGASGSGKTTLLRQLKSVLTPHGNVSGKIYFDGMELSNVSLQEQAAKIGFVMQDPEDQIVTDKVWHELAFGLESLGVDPGTMRLRVAEMACYFGIQDWFHREVAELSGGQKQLLNLASIMAMQPQVLILDEPTSQLDPIAASDFLNTVRKINIELGTTVIITEHRLEDIFHAADRVVVMEAGEIVANGSPREVGKLLYENGSKLFPALPTPTRVFYEAEGEGECPLTVREGRRWLSETFEGKTLSFLSPVEKTTPKTTETALELKELWFRYERDGRDILQGLHFRVPVGRVSAVVGGNGAGKSTMLKVIAGACRAYRGKMTLFGKAVKNGLPEGVAMLPQNPKSLFVKKTLREELEEMCREEEEIRRVAALCKVEHLLNKHPYDLSGGEQQRGALAKVLLTKPRILLLDEPTKGLDSFFKLTFAELLKDLTQDGVTVLMVSHDVEFCADHADFVSMFFDGQILTTDTPRGFFGQNSFYTTAANRMSRCVFRGAVTASDVAELYRKNREGTA